jgi:hypothetical protein
MLEPVEVYHNDMCKTAQNLQRKIDCGDPVSYQEVQTLADSVLSLEHEVTVKDHLPPAWLGGINTDYNGLDEECPRCACKLPAVKQVVGNLEGLATAAVIFGGQVQNLLDPIDTEIHDLEGDVELLQERLSELLAEEEATMLSNIMERVAGLRRDFVAAVQKITDAQPVASHIEDCFEYEPPKPALKLTPAPAPEEKQTGGKAKKPRKTKGRKVA